MAERAEHVRPKNGSRRKGKRRAVPASPHPASAAIPDRACSGITLCRSPTFFNDGAKPDGMAAAITIEVLQATYGDALWIESSPRQLSIFES
jgi:hypothetical protein